MDALLNLFHLILAGKSHLVFLLTLHSTLFVSSKGLEDAKQLVTKYKQNQIKDMSPELWRAKKVIDSTLHPGTCFRQERHLKH